MALFIELLDDLSVFVLIRVLLFLMFLLLGGGFIRRLLDGFEDGVFLSNDLDDGTFFLFCFRSFFFGRRGGGVGINDPDPDMFSS